MTFLSRTLPGIAGKYGQSAGGAFSSDALHARQQAGTDLERTLAQEGSKYALGAATANQAADLEAARSNQSAGLAASQSNLSALLSTLLGNQSDAERVGIANAGNALTAGTTNLGAGFSTQDAILRALNITPSVSTTGITESGGMIDNLLRTLSGGAVPQATQQTELTGRYQDFLNQIFREHATGGSHRSRHWPNTGDAICGEWRVNGHCAGITLKVLERQMLPGSTGIGSLLALLSDRRAKTDVELVGEVDGFPLYRYVYKDDPDKVVNIGLMAQDVEKRKPHAVGRTPEGLKTVNYAAALEDVLKRAA
jgi:hypothetical protein